MKGKASISIPLPRISRFRYFNPSFIMSLQPFFIRLHVARFLRENVVLMYLRYQKSIVWEDLFLLDNYQERIL